MHTLQYPSLRSANAVKACFIFDISHITYVSFSICVVYYTIPKTHYSRRQYTVYWLSRWELLSKTTNPRNSGKLIHTSLLYTLCHHVMPEIHGTCPGPAESSLLNTKTAKSYLTQTKTTIQIKLQLFKSKSNTLSQTKCQKMISYPRHKSWKTILYRAAHTHTANIGAHYSEMLVLWSGY